jgi:hypothetical protein
MPIRESAAGVKLSETWYKLLRSTWTSLRDERHASQGCEARRGRATARGRSRRRLAIERWARHADHATLRPDLPLRFGETSFATMLDTLFAGLLGDVQGSRRQHAACRRLRWVQERPACPACPLRPPWTTDHRRVSRLENEAVLDRTAGSGHRPVGRKEGADRNADHVVDPPVARRLAGIEEERL